MNIKKNIIFSLSIILITTLLSGCLCKKSCSVKCDKIIEEPLEEANDTKNAKF